MELQDVSVWITVMNPEGIDSTHRHFAFGESCVLDDFFEIEVVDIGTENTLYRVTSGTDAAGTTCPRGTLFLMNPHQLSRLQQEARRKAQERERQVQDIRERLKRQRH